MDGIHCGGKVMRGEGRKHRPIVYHKGVSTSERTYKPYIFSNCLLTGNYNPPPAELQLTLLKTMTVPLDSLLV